MVKGGGSSDGGTQDACRISQRFEARPNEIGEWKRQLNERAVAVFGESADSEPKPVVDLNVRRVDHVEFEDAFHHAPLG